MGIDLAPRYADAAERQTLRERLRAKGARFRNGGASISAGPLSSACVACATDSGSRTFYLSLACNRSCYFCFNANQLNCENERSLKPGWRDELHAFLRSGAAVSHVGLTGGEPLMHPPEAVEFFERARASALDAHLRLYTDGDFLDEGLLGRLRDAGLTELRLSVKPDDPGAYDEAVRRLALAKRFIPQVMVEMPVIPGTESEMRSLLADMDAIGAFGINLLEFGFPMTDWAPFAARGFAVANPPFAVPYNYTYAGGLPVAGSEVACLRLLEYAIDGGLSMGVHYCSLENKNRMQVHQQNSEVMLDQRIWDFDGEDFFWKTAKVFDGDVEVAKRALAACGYSWEDDDDEASARFHPSALPLLGGLPIMPAVSINIAESPCGLRELKLEPWGW